MSGHLTIVGLGPAGPELVTAQTHRALADASRVWLRTARHPAAGVAPDAATFDEVYESASSLDEVYQRIVAELVAAAAAPGEVVYAVPGSPAVAEATVARLRAHPTVTVEVLPALSFADLAWVRLDVDPLEAGVRIVDGHRFALEATGDRGPFLVGQVDRREVLSEVKLAVQDPPEEPVVVLQRLGLPDEQVVELAWEDLDRTVEPDHLTALYLPALRARSLAIPAAEEVQRFVELVEILRRECPWDREQTHASLTRHLLEEAYEVVDAVAALDGTAAADQDLAEELGDLLFQVVFHATIAAERDAFSMDDVARGIHDKLYVRHPHVFGDVEAETPDQVRANWEEIKKTEKGRGSIMDGIPGALPALLLALKVQKKAAGAGMAFPSVESARAKIAEELEEVRAQPVAREVGDLLFAVSGLALELDVDAEAALRDAAGRFVERFRLVEQLAAEAELDLRSADQATRDGLWEAAKRRLRSTGGSGDAATVQPG